MGYQALYRRYRPARFEDFVGQEAVIKTLLQPGYERTYAHAYLFCGTRGTGKTSTAKVFAHAVNASIRKTAIPAACAPPARRWRRKTASIFWKSTRPATTAWMRSAICAKR